VTATTVILVAVLAAFLALAWAWRPRKRIDRGAIALDIAFALLGAWALWFALLSDGAAEPAGFAHWKPTILYWTLAAILVAAPALGQLHPIRYILGTYFVFSRGEWKWMNLGFAILFAILGAVNLYIAYRYDETSWGGFKWGCRINFLFLILLRISFVWMDTLARILERLVQRWSGPRP